MPALLQARKESQGPTSSVRHSPEETVILLDHVCTSYSWNISWKLRVITCMVQFITYQLCSFHIAMCVCVCVCVHLSVSFDIVCPFLHLIAWNWDFRKRWGEWQNPFSKQLTSGRKVYRVIFNLSPEISIKCFVKICLISSHCHTSVLEWLHEEISLSLTCIHSCMYIVFLAISLYSSIYLSIYMSVYLSMSVWLSIYPICPCIYPPPSL